MINALLGLVFGLVGLIFVIPIIYVLGAVFWESYQHILYPAFLFLSIVVLFSWAHAEDKKRAAEKAAKREKKEKEDHVLDFNI